MIERGGRTEARYAINSHRRQLEERSDHTGDCNHDIPTFTRTRCIPVRPDETGSFVPSCHSGGLGPVQHWLELTAVASSWYFRSYNRSWQYLGDCPLLYRLGGLQQLIDILPQLGYAR